MKVQIALATAVLTSLFLAGQALAAEASHSSLMNQAKISKAAAEKIALSKIPSGTVKDAELEQEHRALVWSFDIGIPKSHDIHEILVNAKTRGDRLLGTRITRGTDQGSRGRQSGKKQALNDLAATPNRMSRQRQEVAFGSNA